MRILAIAPYTYNTPHWETQLELLQLHIDEGDEITMMGCNAHLPVCDVNWNNELKRCFSCIGKRNTGLGLLSKKAKFEPLVTLTEQDKADMAALNYGQRDMNALLSYEADGWDLGNGVISSLISKIRNPTPDLNKYGREIDDMMRTGFMVHRSVLRYLQQNKFDRVYLFNGRFAPLRAVLRACQKMSVECFIHELGPSWKMYDIYENATPHDLDFVEKRMEKMWAAADPAEREKVGRAFYEERATVGGKIAERNYIKDQQSGALPEGWDNSMQNIVLYNSSEDEYVAVSNQWANPLYPSQLDAIEMMIESLKKDPIANTRLYLRVHPHLKGAKNKWMDRLWALDQEYITIIAPEAPIHSYDLMKAADKVLTFASTVGIEAAYFGTPSIAAGPSYYRNLGSTYNPATHEEVMQLLREPLEPKPIEGALIYGYYQNAKGFTFKYYKPTKLWEGTFMGVRVQQPAKVYYIGHYLEKFPPLRAMFGKLVLNRLIAQTNKVTA